MNQLTSPKQKTTFAFLKGGGAMAEVIQDFDWANSPLGSIETWPQSLQVALGNLLRSAFPMFLFWGEDLISFYNDAFRPSLGNDGKHPAIGKKGSEVWPEIWDTIGPLVTGVLESGKPVWFEDRLVPFFRNGKIEDVYWTFSYSAAIGDEGTNCGVLVTCMETTRRVLMQQKIEAEADRRGHELQAVHHEVSRSGEYLQQIIDLFKEPLQVLEPVFEKGKLVDFRYKLTNAAYAAYAKTSPEALQNRRVGEVFPNYFQSGSFQKILESYESGQALTWEMHINMDGLDQYSEMNASPLDGAVVVHFTDLTHLKDLQRELLGKIKELERSNQNLEEFAYAASHDLKEPIRKIQVFTTRLKAQLSDRLNDSEQMTFNKIEKASHRMGLLVDDLLLYSHVSQKPVEMEQIDLNVKIQRILEDLEVDVQDKKAVITVGQLPVVWGYRRQLQQLFQNLVSNAIKYAKEGQAPRIDISAHETTEAGKPYYLIEVRDEGIGFEPEYADKIFQMFTRLHGASEYSGTGVGLSIAKKVVENHNGMIRAKSKPGEGACFQILLPAETSPVG